MDPTLSQLLINCSIASVMVPLIVWGIRRKSANYAQKTLGLLIWVSLIVEIAARLTSHVFYIGNNLWILHVFTVVEFAILTLIYKRQLSSLFRERVFYGAIWAFLGMAILNTLYLEPLTAFNSNVRGVESLILICWALSYFYLILKELNIEHLESTPLFWISVSILIYFSGNLIVFVLSNYVLPHYELSMATWGMHAILNIVHHIIFAIALWVNPQQ